MGAEPRREGRRGAHRRQGLGSRRSLGAAYSNEAWRLWSFPWQADGAGSHTITVRATDNTGAVQTEQWADPVPDGATGWHSVLATTVR